MKDKINVNAKDKTELRKNKAERKKDKERSIHAPAHGFALYPLSLILHVFSYFVPFDSF